MSPQALSFAKQLERLGQTLDRRFSGGVSEEVMCGVMGCLRLMEGALSEVQASVLKVRIPCCSRHAQTLTNAAV